MPLILFFQQSDAATHGIFLGDDRIFSADVAMFIKMRCKM